MDDLSRLCCLDPECPEYGKRGAGNLTVPHRYGPGTSRRMLRGRTCKARSSERKGTPLFDARLPPEKVESVPEHVAEGGGVRQTGRLGRVTPNTVARYSRIAGEHARGAHDDLVAVSPPRPRPSSMRSGRSSPRRRRIVTATTRPTTTRGTAGTTSRGTRITSWSSPSCRASRTAESTEALVTEFRRRTGGRLMNLMTSDDYPAFEAAIPRASGETVTRPRTGKRGRPRTGSRRRA